MKIAASVIACLMQRYIKLSNIKCVPNDQNRLKFSFSEKATKICTILEMVLTVSKRQNHKEGGGWMAFSEKLNFTDIKWLILTI